MLVIVLFKLFVIQIALTIYRCQRNDSRERSRYLMSYTQSTAKGHVRAKQNVK